MGRRSTTGCAWAAGASEQDGAAARSTQTHSRSAPRNPLRAQSVQRCGLGRGDTLSKVLCSGGCAPKPWAHPGAVGRQLAFPAWVTAAHMRGTKQRVMTSLVRLKTPTTPQLAERASRAELSGMGRVSRCVRLLECVSGPQWFGAATAAGQGPSDADACRLRLRMLLTHVLRTDMATSVRSDDDALRAVRPQDQPGGRGCVAAHVCGL